MLKFYLAKQRTAKRLDRVLSDFEQWSSQAKALLESHKAIDFLVDGFGIVIGLEFEKTPPIQDSEKYLKKPTIVDGRSFFLFASKRNSCFQLGKSMDFVEESLKCIGFLCTWQRPRPEILKIENQWIIRCDNESHHFGNRITWSEFVPIGCKRVGPMYVDRLRGA